MDRVRGRRRAVPSDSESIDVGEMIQGTMIACDSWRFKLESGKIVLVDCGGAALVAKWIEGGKALALLNERMLRSNDQVGE